MSAVLENYNVLHSSDVDEVCDKISNAYCSHSLKLKHPNTRLQTQYNRYSFGNISFNFLEYGADVYVNIGEFKNFYMLEIPLDGYADIYYGKNNVHSEGKLGAVVSPHQNVSSLWSCDAKRLMIQIDRKALEHYTSSILGCSLNKPLEFSLSLDVSNGLGLSLYNYVKYIVTEIEANPNFSNLILIRHQIENTVLSLLLATQISNYSELLKAAVTPGSPKHIQRAYDYIMEHYREEITIDDLIEASGMSGRTLFEGFKRYKGVTPMEAIRSFRLQGVKQALLNADSSDTVTQIAYKWGFSHMGRFAHYYEQVFGEKPSVTIRKNR